MDIIQNTIEIGLKTPVKLFHLTDSHLCYADERDSERIQKLALSRQLKFNDNGGQIFRYFQESIRYGNEHCDMTIHTGDMIDFISDINLEKARAAIDEAKNFFYVTGNHEFCRYVGEGWEDISFKMSIYKRIRAGLGMDMFFATREINGLNIVGIDNSYHQIELWQLERLRREVAKGLPIILVMHAALFEQSLFDMSYELNHGSCTWLVGCDEDHLLRYEEYYAIQQRPTDTTLRFIDYVYSQPSIAAILAGHLHASFESKLPSGIMQYVTGSGFKGIAREITVL